MQTERRAGRTALVLGGGGAAGVAWEATLVREFAAAGVDLASADVVVGTSAGSVVGTAIRSGRFDQWYSQQLTDAAAHAEDPNAVFDIEPAKAAFAAVAQSTDDPETTRARLGRFALGAATAVPAEMSLANIRSLLATSEWPDAELRVTAVDALDGSFRVLDRSSGVELGLAVAASCAVPGYFATVPMDGRDYMDGGMRSATNADVAADCDRILVIACGPEAPVSPLGPSLPAVFDELSTRADVMVIEADAESIAAFGANTLLMSTVPASVGAAERQAASVIERLREFWR